MTKQQSERAITDQAPHDATETEANGIIGLFSVLPKASFNVVGGIGNFAIGVVFESVRGVNHTVRSLGAKATVALEIVVEGILRADHPELYPDDEPSDKQ